MAIVTLLTITEEVPHEPGETFTFKRLSWKTLEESRLTRQRNVMGDMRAAGSEILGYFRDANASEVEAALTADPLVNYDHGTLLRASITGWSYAEKCTPANIDGLDETTKDWAVKVIARISGITTVDEADQKNA